MHLKDFEQGNSYSHKLSRYFISFSNVFASIPSYFSNFFTRQRCRLRIMRSPGESNCDRHNSNYGL